MPITKEMLTAKLAELAQTKQQALAQLNAIEGAELVVRQLLDAAQKPAEPDCDPAG
jgi:hypothetical protein